MGVINYSKVQLVNLQDQNLPKKTYALVQSRGKMNVDGLASHMSDHNSLFSKGVIKGILEDFVSCTQELICDGWIVDMGSLGTFSVSLKSNGVCESLVDDATGKKRVFNAANITGVNLRFKAGSGFNNMIDKVTLHEVLARKQAQKLLEEKQDKMAAGTWDAKAEYGDDAEQETNQNGTERE